MARTPKNNTRTNHTKAVVIIVALMVLTVLLVIMAPRTFYNGDSTTNVSIPLIKTTLTSEEDGHDYTLQTLFTVSMDRGDRSKVSVDYLQEALAEILTELDFDKLAGYNGIAYLNEEAAALLREHYLQADSNVTVYVTGMLVGDRFQLPDISDRRSEVMKGLFQNIK